MWTRAQLKAQAKIDVKRSYWGLVLMSLIMAFLTGGGGSTGGSSSGSSGSSSGSSSNSASSIFDSIDPGKLIAIIIAVGIVALIVIAVGLALKICVFNALSIGGYRYFIEATCEEKKVSDLKCLGMAFQKGIYGNVIKTLFLKDLYIFLWSLLLIVPGIIKSFEYMMVPYILAENPEVETKEAFRLSKEMMDGEKWNTFVLGLSFIGWLLLCICTCGILAVFYVTPYINMTNAELYQTLKKKATTDYFDRSIGSYDSFDYGAPQSSGMYGGMDTDYTSGSAFGTDTQMENSATSQTTYGITDNADSSTEAGSSDFGSSDSQDTNW